jgi:hypothetical protein
VISYSFIAHASSETNQIPLRGEGAGRISGYNISDVHYQLADDPSYISGVEFDLDGPASQVLIGFDTASDQIFTCYNVGQRRWLCRVDDVEVSLINKLRVIAVG